MARFRLRQPENPISQFPLRLRASALAQSMWCDYQCRIRILEGQEAHDEDSEETDATATGTIMHKVLEESQGRRFPHELELMEKLAPYNDTVLGFVRKFNQTQIYADVTAHPDDLQVLPSRRVAFVEYKTTKVQHRANNTYEQDLADAHDFIERWKLPMSRLQAQVYAWVFEPILYDLGYFVDDKHAVMYYDSATFSPIGNPFIVDYNAAGTTQSIQRIIDYLNDETLCITPHPFKCRFCQKTLRVKCPIWQKEHQGTSSEAT
jgi:hypothetical protein